MRLIDLDALIEKYGDWYTEEGTEEGYIGTIEGIVDNMPTIEERKSGKWIWKTRDVYECSECETETHVDECMGEPIYNFCPYCGCAMGEGEQP